MIKQGAPMITRGRGVSVRLACAVLAGVSVLGAVRQAAAQEYYRHRADTYREFCLLNEFARLDAVGEPIYDAGYGPTEDLGNSGLLNSEEWRGWVSEINGQMWYFGWMTKDGAEAEFGVEIDVMAEGPILSQLDSDGDGVPDYLERQHGTNPREADTDGDGMYDVWEIYMGMNPRDDGQVRDPVTGEPTGEITLEHPDADWDGDGLTNIEEQNWGGFHPAPATSPYELSIVRDPDDLRNSIALDGRYSHPKWHDTSGDDLIDSFKLDFWHTTCGGDEHMNPARWDDKNADPDRDGLTNFREQCVHPLLAHYWSGNSIPGNGMGTLVAPGYMNLAQYDGPGNAHPDNPGVVEWGHPISRSPYGGVRRWTNPFNWDSSNDNLPDGWKLEHGLNPLSGRSEHFGHPNPSGPLGDPDADGIPNMSEYFGQSGYRLDYITGTGDETNPWITRVFNNDMRSSFAQAIGQYVILARGVQAPSGFLGRYGHTFTGSFDPSGEHGLIGFFDPVALAAGHYVPIAGVPFPVWLDDEMAGVHSRFNPFATAMGAIVFRDAPDNPEKGVFTPGVDDAWLSLEPPDELTGEIRFEFGRDIIIVDNTGLVGGEVATGYITENAPVMWPMPGRDTDDDGYPDLLEITRDVSAGKYPSSPVHSTDPFQPGAMRVLDASGIPVPPSDDILDTVSRRAFSRSFTIECWVYLEGEVGADFRGSFVRGRVSRAGMSYLDGYNLGVRPLVQNGVTNYAVPTFSFEAPSGTEYLIQGGGSIPMNRWVHLAGVYEHDQNALSLYIDGLLEQSVQVMEESSSYCLVQSVGAQDRSGGLVLLAQDRADTGVSFAERLWMDEVRIWGMPRSANEVADHHATLVDPFQEPDYELYPHLIEVDEDGNRIPVINTLLAYYTFDDGGRMAMDFTKRARSSLVGFDYPHDPHVAGFPRNEYLYHDALFGIPASRVVRDPVDGTISTNHYFSFDRNRAAPVRGMVDGERGAFDSDGDGLPDAWELVHEFNPFSRYTPDHHPLRGYDPGWRYPSMVRDDQGDPDGDGLPTLYEYWARTNPRKPDTTGNGIPDGEEDFDGDGLPNRLEYMLGSRPDLVDTDGDMRTDAEEQAVGTSPTDALSPRRTFAAWFDGMPGSFLDIRPRSDLRLRNYTIQALIQPSSKLLQTLGEGEGATILRKIEQATIDGKLAANYELRVVRRGDVLTPEARFVSVTPDNEGRIFSATSLDPTSEFEQIELDYVGDLSANYSHVAATYDYNTGILNLYLNHRLIDRVEVVASRPPMSGKGPRSLIRMGENYIGAIREVSIRSATLPAQMMIDQLETPPRNTETNLVAYYRMDDGAFNIRQVYGAVRGIRDAPPAGIPEVGHRYIVDVGGRGDWEGHDGDIAMWTGPEAGWQFTTPTARGLVELGEFGQRFEASPATRTWRRIPANLPSVSHASRPTRPVPGDSWPTGTGPYWIARFESGEVHTGRVRYPTVFHEGMTLGVPAQQGDFGYSVSQEMYYRLTEDGWHLWGAHRQHLANAMGKVEQVYASEGALLADRTVHDTVSGDAFFVKAPVPAIYYYTMAAPPNDVDGYEIRPVYPRDRLLDMNKGEVFDYLVEGGVDVFRRVADARTDGGHLYIHVNADGVVYRSDGVDAWARWGLLPNFQDFTLARGWEHQWSQSAWLHGSVCTAGIDTGEIDRTDMTDSSGDGIPDWWKIKYGLDPYSSLDAHEDPDGDGLTNYEEWLSGTDPFNPDTSGNGILDGDEDPWGYGLTRLEELRIYGTHPGRYDTDDDGVSDGDEVRLGSNPLHPMSVFHTNEAHRIRYVHQARPRSLVLAEVPRQGVQLYDRSRFELDPARGWTVEFWFRRGEDPNGTFFEYRGSHNSLIFELDEGAPRGRVVNVLGDTVVSVGGADRVSSLPPERWVHLALVWAPAENRMTIYANGSLLAGVSTSYKFESAGGRVTLWSDFSGGHIDQFRLWNLARSEQELLHWYQRLYPAPGYVSNHEPAQLPNYQQPEQYYYNDAFYSMQARAQQQRVPRYEYGQPLVAYFRFDDGGEAIEDFAYLGQEAYRLAGLGDDVRTTEEAYPVFGVDDADGDGLPEWYLDIYDACYRRQRVIGPYHHLDDETVSDYPITLAQGWSTPHGTEGYNDRYYYTTMRFRQPDGRWRIEFNVWKDIDPDPLEEGQEYREHYRGRGRFDEWDEVLHQDTVWFTEEGTMGSNHGLYRHAEDFWLDRPGGEPGVYDLQQVLGIMYYRTFTSYGSIGGAHTRWWEDDQYISVKDDAVGGDGMNSAFQRFFYLEQEPERAELEIILFNVLSHEIHINGVLYEQETDSQGGVLLSLLRQGRNSIYVKTKNEVYDTDLEQDVHYSADFDRDYTRMKFDLSLTVNDDVVIPRGDDTVADPRSVWHGAAWSDFYADEIGGEFPVPDIEGRGWAHEDFAIPLDEDGDGLDIYYEFKIQTNPKSSDTTGDGVPDPYDDFDGDGLSNIQEMRYGTDPTRPDTDRDGLLDGEEVAQLFFDPADSLSPFVPRMLFFPEASMNNYVESPLEPRFNLKSLTFQAWVAPFASDRTNYVIRRSRADGTDERAFSLGLDEHMIPFVEYDAGSSRVVVKGPEPVRVNVNSRMLTNWTHLACSYDENAHELKLFVNGHEVGGQRTTAIPLFNFMAWPAQRIGEGFIGGIDEVSIWNRAITPLAATSLRGTEDGLVAYYRFDDGLGHGEKPDDDGRWRITLRSYGQVQDFADRPKLRENWRRNWLNAASLHGLVFHQENHHLRILRLTGDSDMDGIPDEYERQHRAAMSPLVFDSNVDADGDGWDNMAEFYARTLPHDPSSYPQPILSFKVHAADNAMTLEGQLNLWAYNRSDMAGRPTGKAHLEGDIFRSEELTPRTRRVFDNELNRYVIFPFTVNVPRSYGRAIRPGTLSIEIPDPNNPWEAYVDEEGILRGADGEDLGTLSGNEIRSRHEHLLPYARNPLRVTWYEIGDIYPMTPSTRDFYEGKLLQGDNWLFLFVDENGNNTFDAGEYAGIPDQFPVHLKWGGLDDIRVGLTRKAPAGFGRFSWGTAGGDEDDDDEGGGEEVERDYYVSVVSAGDRVVLNNKKVRRRFIHEGDFIAAGYPRGLPGPATYRWYVRTRINGTPIAEGRFNVEYPDSSPRARHPSVPSGNFLAQGRPTFRWQMPEHAPSFELRVRDAAGNTVLSQVARTPYVDQNGMTEFQPDGLYYGFTPRLGAVRNFPAGAYTWQVRAKTPIGDGSWTDARSFTFDMGQSQDGPFTISGNIAYFGRVTNAPLVVAAYKSDGFSGVPVQMARFEMVPSPNPPLRAGITPFELKGLPPGSYRVMAFLDSNGNGVWDEWESYGFIASAQCAFRPARIDLAEPLTGQKILIRDMDTDGDGLPDAWEWEQFGSLNVAGPGPVRGYTAAGGAHAPNWRGLNHWEAYQLGTDPRKEDSSGDLLTDLQKWLLGLDLHGTDTDGDGFPDWLELMLGTDPYDPTCYPMIDDLSISGDSILLADRRSGRRSTRMVDQQGIDLDYVVYVGVEYTDDMASGEWRLLGDMVEYNPGMAPLLRDLWPEDEHGFYRLVWEQRAKGE